MSSDQRRYRFGDLVVRADLNEIEADGVSKHLDPLLMDILVHLMENNSAPVPAADLLDRFWPDTVVEESTIHRRISQLRQALGDDARQPVYIATVPKRGYRAIAAVAPLAPGEESESLLVEDVTPALNPALALNQTTAWMAAAFGLLIVVVAWFGYQALIPVVAPTTAPQLSLVDPVPKIAVLPFQNFSPDQGNVYLASGFQEDIISRLAQIRGLQVTSRTSVRRYATDNVPSIRQIADELAVTHIIEGSLRREGDHLRVTVQLIDAAQDGHVWAETYDRAMLDIFAIQTDVAHQVAARLAGQFGDDEAIRVDYTPTSDMQAYELVLKGREQLDIGTVISLSSAADLMARAAAQDPQLAEAHAGLSRALFLQTFLGVTWSEVRTTALAASERSLALDPDSSNIHANYAHIREVWEGDSELAARHYQRALELEPNNSFALLHYGAFMANYLGLTADALPLLQRALVLNPLSGETAFYLAGALRDLNKPEEATQVVMRALEFDPQDIDLLGLEIELHLSRGEVFAAFTKSRDLVVLDPLNLQSQSNVANMLRFVGEPAAAQRWVDRIEAASALHILYFTTQAMLYIDAKNLQGLEQILNKWQVLNTRDRMEQLLPDSGPEFGMHVEAHLLTLRADEARTQEQQNEEQLLRLGALEKADVLLRNGDDYAVIDPNRHLVANHVMNLRLLGQNEESTAVLQAAVRSAEPNDLFSNSELLIARAFLGDSVQVVDTAKVGGFYNQQTLELIKDNRFGLFDGISDDPDFRHFIDATIDANAALRTRIRDELPTLLDASTGL